MPASPCTFTNAMEKEQKETPDEKPYYSLVFSQEILFPCFTGSAHTSFKDEQN